MPANKLLKYNKKRDFKITAEPEGKTKKSAKGFSYLIQKHEASHLHYDFRLELNGTLKSWAVAKGPSVDPAVKRLAIEVEDHPVSYGSFEGTIPKGQYGGGTVMLWDTGSWEPVGDPEKGLKAGKLVFVLHGERLKGEWTLVRMHFADDTKKNQWLLIKHEDEFAKPDENDKLLKKFMTSVTTGRKMEEIPEGKKVTKTEKSSEEKVSKVTKPKAEKAKVKKKSYKLPAFKAPQLATLSDKLPEGKQWIHEIKFDGYRTVSRINGSEVQMLTRRGLDWTAKYSSLAEELQDFKFDSAILDGEIVALDKKGRSNFMELQKALKAGEDEALQYYIFDILYLDGENLEKRPLKERKEILKKLFSKQNFAHIFFSDSFKITEEEFAEKICKPGYEGIISKLADKPYVSGRGKDWLKYKCSKRQEFVIGGFTLPTNQSKGLGAMLMGYYEGKKLIYCGKVGTGMDHKTSIEIRTKLEKLKQKTSPFESVSTLGKKGAIYVKPSLVCEVEFTEWTTDGALRHPSFQGLRSDKPAKEIHKDIPIHLNGKAMKESVDKPTAKNTKGRILVSGIGISHPDRIIYPESNLTKLDLVEYYDKVADYMLPHIKDRFISLLRCPEGMKGECFFQRHEKIASEFIHEMEIKNEKHQSPYIYIKDKKGLLTLIQFGAIDIHAWGSKIDKPELPDRLIFDIDPDPEVGWGKVMEAAAEIKLRMDDLGLKSFLKTTGGKGLHVVIPITRKYDWGVIKSFAKGFAEEMASDSPEKYVSNMSKTKRKGKMFIDYLRNDMTATAVAAYSARAREGAPVSTPISWRELNNKLDPSKFTIETVVARLQKQKSDPWEEIGTIKQSLTAATLKAYQVKI